jgi:CRP-like cAMP-binding protein
MGCPNPLDPLCVAVMLQLSNGPLTGDDIARDLRVEPIVVEKRLQRLSALGAVHCEGSGDECRLLPHAPLLVLQIAESRTAPNGRTSADRAEDSLNARLTRLQQEPMFRDLPREELIWVARVSRTQDLAPGELLILEGDVCRGLYVVDSGTIRLSKGSSSSAFGFGREQTIGLMRPGDSFNEVPVFDDGPNPVTAEAIEDSRVILVPGNEVRDLVQRSPEFAGLIIKIMSHRLRHMLAMIEDVSMRDVTGRVAKILLQVQHPSVGVGAGLTNGRRLTQREIAEMAGTAREVVARVLKKMERTGAIVVNRGDVRILDPELLESFT